MSGYYTIPNKPETPRTAGTNGLAITSLIFGIISWIILPVIGGLVAVITGHIARAQTKRQEQSGAGLALAGLILGYLNVLAVIGVGILAAIALPAYQDYVYKSKTTQAFQVVRPVMEEVEQNYQAAQTVAGFEPQQLQLSAEAARYWQEAQLLSDGTLALEFAQGNTVAQPLRGQTLYLKPQQVNGEVVWSCMVNGVSHAQRWLPASCH